MKVVHYHGNFAYYQLDQANWKKRVYDYNS